MERTREKSGGGAPGERWWVRVSRLGPLTISITILTFGNSVCLGVVVGEVWVWVVGFWLVSGLGY